jgi:hypothetical protein
MDGVRADEAQPIKPTSNTMKTTTLIVIAAAIGLSGAAHAEEGKGPRKAHKLPPEVIAKFDKDGDGKLNEEEHAAAKAARGEMEAGRKKEMLEKFDADKDGKLNDDEKAAMRGGMKKKMLEKFDKDGDGELNEEEKAEMRKAMMHHPGGPKRPKGKGDGPRPGKGGGDVEAPGAGE